MNEYETLVDALRECVDRQDDGRLLAGELAVAIASRYGQLRDAAREAGIQYKTLYEYRSVILFYQHPAQHSAVQNVVGNSDARALLEELPTLRWSHLRAARALMDRDEAIAALMVAASEGMTIEQFQRYIQRRRAAMSDAPVARVELPPRGGWQVVIRNVGWNNWDGGNHETD